MKPLLIAHRCGPDIYPEQSIASARHARENGADMVEMDVQYTCDGVPVICHDPNTARIFGVDKLCRDMPLQEFMALRHVSDRSYPSHSLRDVLECFDGPILLHCKVTGEPLKDLVRCITDSHAEGRCVIGVLFAQDAELIKDLCPRIRILVQASVVSRWARVISLKSEEGRSPLQSFLPGALVAQSHSMAMILSYSRILRDFSFICEIPPQTVLH